MHYSFDFRRRAATDQFPSSLSSSTAFPVERKTQYVHFLSSRQLPNYKKKHHQLLPCIGLTSVASASNEQPLIRSGVHRIFKRIEGDMVGSVQLGDVFRQVPRFKFCKAEVQGSEASQALQALDKLLAWSLECVALVRKRRRIFGTTSHQ